MKVLLVEDSPADAELILRSLRDLGRPVEHLRVASAPTLLESFAQFAPEVILTDLSMPGFSGQQALVLATEHRPDIPFLFVSGTIGEELAIEALQRGALDYVLKDNLRRLPSAIERALQITESRRQRDQMQQALRESEERFRSIVENSQDWIWEMDPAGAITYSNSAIEQILGRPPHTLIGATCTGFMHPDDLQGPGRELYRAVAAGEAWQGLRLRFYHRNGNLRVLETTGSPMRDQHGNLTGFRGIDQDITERLEYEASIHGLARIHAVLSAVSSEVLRAPNRDALLHSACRLAVEHGGFSTACIGLVTKEKGLYVDAAHGDPNVIAFVKTLCALPAEETAKVPGFIALRENRHVVIDDVAQSDLVAARRDAMLQIGVASQIVLPISSPPWGVMGLYSANADGFDENEIDLLERLVSEIDYAVDFIAKSERLEYLAYHNPVTGLPNRSAFQEQMQPLLRSGATVIAVVDVKRLSQVNDSRGRDFGDALLRMIGERLQALIGADGLVAHPEADRFALGYRCEGPMDAEIVRLQALLENFSSSKFVLHGEEVHVDLHGGLAVSPEHGVDGTTLKRHAMAALTEGKRRRTRVYAFNNELQTRASRRIELERDLRRAVDDGALEQFEVYYQPKIDAATQRMVAAEALLRWNLPGSGRVSPAEFIPVLEDTGLIVPVGRWVMRRALETAAKWRALHHDAFRICVNVSARELRDSGFLDSCSALLQPHADAQLIDIELTESLLMEDIGHSVRLLEGLRGLGCGIAIDDFGTGYSSLNYLTRLPVDTLKIDQSFVALLSESPETMSLITNIINLAHSLSLTVVAEGVETDEQAKLLRLLRCDVLQGYLYGRPVPEAEFVTKFL